jgi:hypothetical protein
LTNSTPAPINWYAGFQFDQCFKNEADWSPTAAQLGLNSPVQNVVDILDNFAAHYPQWAAQGFQIAGYVWFQGNRDILTGPPYSTGYETNMVRFIKQLRAYYANRYPSQCSTNAPFVLATGCGDPQTNGQGLVVANQQLAVSDPVKHPEFAGNVKTMDTRGYWRSAAVSPTSTGYHYNHNAETFLLVGDALGRGMIELLETGPAFDYAAWATNYPGYNLTDPNADLDGDGLSNNAERLFGLNPINSASSQPVSFNGTTFTYTRRRPALTGYTYTVWYSTDLQTWLEDTGAVQTPGSPVADVETVVVNLSPALWNGPQLFLRVRASP